MKIHLVSGFVGSGKTTAITNAALLLKPRGISVAAITNDQGTNLVDTESLRSHAVETREIGHGCFCCRFDALSDVLADLDTTSADVVFAEAVGSCTDIAATVVRPLLLSPALGGAAVTHTTFVDIRLLGMWLTGLGLPFGDDVNYIFERQMSEADFIVVNKADTMSPASAARIVERARAAWPETPAILQNSRDSRQVQAWIDLLQSGSVPAGTKEIDVDYDRYAAGEAALLWHNSSVEMQGFPSSSATAATALLHEIARASARLVRPVSSAIAGADIDAGPKQPSHDDLLHARIKVFVNDGTRSLKLDLTQKGAWEGDDPSSLTGDRLHVVLNARVESADADVASMLQDIADRMVRSGVCAVCRVKGQEQFRPAYPQPQQRA